MDVMSLVDRVNLMTYDLVSAYSTITGHHTPLYSTESQRVSADHATRYLLSKGVDPGKIVIGAAFYARVWEDVDAEEDDNPLYRKARFKEYVEFKHHSKYFQKDFIMRWDSEAQAPFAYNSIDRVFATFDDRRSVRLKVEYVIDHGLGGIMFWQLGHDTYRDGLLAEITQVKNTNLATVGDSK